MHHMGHACRQASHPYDFMVHCNVIICLPCTQVEGLQLKLTATHFNALNKKNTNEHAGKDYHCHAR